VTVSSEGLRFRGRGAQTHPAFRIPLSLRAHAPLVVSMELAVDRLEPGTRFDLLLERPGTDPAVHRRFGARVTPGEAKALLRVDPTLKLFAGTEATLATAGDGQRLPGRLRFEFDYTPDPPSLALRRGTVTLAALPLDAPVAGGDWVLTLGLNALPHGPGDWVALADVRLLSLTVRGAEGRLALRTRDGKAAEIGRIGRRVLGGQVDSVRERLDVLGSDEESTARANAFYLLSLEHEDAGSQRERIGFMWEMLEMRGSQWFKRRWRADLLYLEPPVIDALAAACATSLRGGGEAVTPEALADRAARLVRKTRERPLSVLLFRAAGEDFSARRHPREFGMALVRLGRNRDALAVLEPRERARPGSTRGWAGLAAYRLRDFARAVELWGDDAGRYDTLHEDAKQRLQRR
jgi:hypothetical protein